MCANAFRNDVTQFEVLVGEGSELGNGSGKEVGVDHEGFAFWRE